MGFGSQGTISLWQILRRVNPVGGCPVWQTTQLTAKAGVVKAHTWRPLAPRPLAIFPRLSKNAILKRSAAGKSPAHRHQMEMYESFPAAFNKTAATMRHHQNWCGNDIVNKCHAKRVRRVQPNPPLQTTEQSQLHV